MIIKILILLLAIPIGFLLAHLTKDELKQAQPFFYILTIAGVVIAGWTALIARQDIALTALFITIVAFISLIQSKHLNNQ